VLEGAEIQGLTGELGGTAGGGIHLVVAGGHRSHLAAGEEQEGEDAAAATDPPTHPAEWE